MWKKLPLSFIKVYSQILAKTVLNIFYTRGGTMHVNEVFPLSLVAHKCPLSPLAQDVRPWRSSSQGVVLGPASASLRILLRIRIFYVPPDLLNQKPWIWNTAIFFFDKASRGFWWMLTKVKETLPWQLPQALSKMMAMVPRIVFLFPLQLPRCSSVHLFPLHACHLTPLSPVPSGSLFLF